MESRCQYVWKISVRQAVKMFPAGEPGLVAVRWEAESTVEEEDQSSRLVWL